MFVRDIICKSYMEFVLFCVGNPLSKGVFETGVSFYKHCLYAFGEFCIVMTPVETGPLCTVQIFSFYLDIHFRPNLKGWVAIDIGRSFFFLNFFKVILRCELYARGFFGSVFVKKRSIVW